MIHILPLIIHAHAQHGFGPLALLGASEGIKLISSLFSKNKAQEGLDALGKPIDYTVSPEQQDAYNQSQSRSRFGYSPSEIGSFRQRQAQDINTAAQGALDTGGGNLSRTISAMGNISKLGSDNQFAASDAQIHDRHIHDFYTEAGKMQAQRNRITAGQREDYNMAAQAYGMSAQQQNQNVFDTIGQVADVAAFKWGQGDGTAGGVAGGNSYGRFGYGGFGGYGGGGVGTGNINYGNQQDPMFGVNSSNNAGFGMPRRNRFGY